jgi:hypothetical protein
MHFIDHWFKWPVVMLQYLYLDDRNVLWHCRCHLSIQTTGPKKQTVLLHCFVAEGEGVDGKDEKEDYDPWPHYRFTG